MVSEPLEEEGRERIEDLVAEANAISAQWHLNTEFALQPSVEAEDAVVLVKKRVGDQQCSVVEWKRPALEARVAFLRELASSLQDADVTVESRREHMTTLSSPAFEGVSPSGESNRTAEEASEVSRPPPPEAPQTNTPSFPLLEPVSSIQSQATPPTLPHRVRLLGLGRVFMPPLKSCSSGPMVAGIFDAMGQSIGKLFLHLQYTTGAEKEARRTSFLALARRPSLLAVAQASQPKAAQTVMRLHLDKVAFDETQWVASEGISLTLKRWSSKPTLAATSASDAKIHGATGATTVFFSTPRTPSSVFSDGRAVSSEATLRLFDVSKVFETKLCFGDHTQQSKVGPESSTGAGGAKANGSWEAKDDFVAFEVWGHGQASRVGEATTAALSPAPPVAQSVDFYASVDIDEREQDGVFRPVAVKADGTLRLHANQPRRLNVRVTQTDDRAMFALVSVECVAISRAFASTVDTACLSVDGVKCTQWLLSPGSIRPRSDQLPQNPLLSNEDASRAAASVDGVGTQYSALPGAWRALDFRVDSARDPSSRSLLATLKWDREPQQSLESIDSEGSRSVFRVAIAVKAAWSHIPIVVTKSVVAKIARGSVTTKLKLTRELEFSRMAWWVRESSSRDYRLGTWYTADVSVGRHRATDSVFESAGAVDSSDGTRAAVDSVVASHIRGLERLELALELEHLRQQILKMTPFSATETVDASARGADELSFDKVAECLSTLFENGDDEEQRFEIVELQSSMQLFVRKKTHRELLIGVKYGNVVDLSPVERVGSVAVATSSQLLGASWQRDETHCAHFTAEPSHLAGGSVSEMTGFLMLSTTLELDEAAVAPLSVASVTGVSNPREKASKPTKGSWERRWVVLKRPFLYVYKSFTLKDQVGVLDISKCQLLASPVPAASAASPSTSSNGRDHLASSISSSSSHSSKSLYGARSKGLASIPFSFQLVCRAGAKCVVWTLQASTASEMRAWLVAVDPVKTEARYAAVDDRSSFETPAATG